MFIWGESRMPIIHFLLEFRLQPLSGTGEDWVSLVIPYNTRATIQQYLLRGLTSATSYEARIRTKTRHGVSHYSTTWQFTTWSPWTTSRPATVFLPRTGHESFTDSDQYKNNFAKGRISFTTEKILTIFFFQNCHHLVGLSFIVSHQVFLCS